MTFAGLEPDALATAWIRLVDDEPMLRVVLDGDRGVIRDVPEARVRREDFSQLGEAAGHRLDLLCAAEQAEPIDLARGPLARLVIAALPGGKHAVVLVFHHLVLDGWSGPLLMARLFAHYEAARSGITAPAAGPRGSFTDYARWLAARDDEAAAQRYWRDALGDWSGAAGLGIARDSPGSAVRDEVRLVLSRDEGAKIAAAARAARVTPAILYQAALALLIGRYRDDDDVVFGLTLSGRSAPIEGIESAIGLFINTLPLRVRLDPAEDAFALLARLRTCFAALQEREHDSAADVARLAGLPAGRTLVEIALVIESYPADAMAGVATDVRLLD